MQGEDAVYVGHAAFPDRLCHEGIRNRDQPLPTERRAIHANLQPSLWRRPQHRGQIWLTRTAEAEGVQTVLNLHGTDSLRVDGIAAGLLIKYPHHDSRALVDGITLGIGQAPTEIHQRGNGVSRQVARAVGRQRSENGLNLVYGTKPNDQSHKGDGAIGVRISGLPPIDRRIVYQPMRKKRVNGRFGLQNQVCV